MKIKPRSNLIEGLILFWDPTHNVFHFSDFELTPSLDEIAGYAGSIDIRHKYLIGPRTVTPHKFLDLLKINRQIKTSDLVDGFCSFRFLYQCYGQPKGFEINEIELCNKSSWGK